MEKSLALGKQTSSILGTVNAPFNSEFKVDVGKNIETHLRQIKEVNLVYLFWCLIHNCIKCTVFEDFIALTTRIILNNDFTEVTSKKRYPNYHKSTPPPPPPNKWETSFSPSSRPGVFMQSHDHCTQAAGDFCAHGILCTILTLGVSCVFSVSLLCREAQGSRKEI